QPDFWLPDHLVWVEIKSGPPTPAEIQAARMLRDATGERVYILGGWPAHGRYMVNVFTRRNVDITSRRPDWCNLALCQLFDCGFNELAQAFRQAKKSEAAR
ncbi:MAG: hypothetical protein AAF485_05725, partial [Chloroflexota bacterium]